MKIIATLLFSVLVILCITQDVTAQLVPVLPPLPLPSDSEQIHSTITLLSSALHLKSLQMAKAEHRPTNVSPSTEPPSISSIIIENLVIGGDTAVAQCRFAACDGSGVSEALITLVKHGVSWRIVVTNTFSLSLQ